MSEEGKNKSKYSKYGAIIITAIVLPTIVSTISHLIEYNFFQTQNPEKEKIESVQQSSPSRDEFESLDNSRGESNLNQAESTVKQRPKINDTQQIKQSNQDLREIKILPFEYVQREYNWATRLVGWFFVILPAILSIGGLIGEDGSGCLIGCLLGFWFVFGMWIILTIAILIPYLPAIYYLGLHLEFDPLIYAFEIYEGWANKIVGKL